MKLYSRALWSIADCCFCSPDIPEEMTFGIEHLVGKFNRISSRSTWGKNKNKKCEHRTEA